VENLVQREKDYDFGHKKKSSPRKEGRGARPGPPLKKNSTLPEIKKEPTRASLLSLRNNTKKKKKKKHEREVRASRPNSSPQGGEFGGVGKKASSKRGKSVTGLRWPVSQRETGKEEAKNLKGNLGKTP